MKNQCKWDKQWKDVVGFDDNLLLQVHQMQSEKDWLKRVRKQYSVSEVNRISTYCIAVRQELRKRGLPLILGS